MARFDIRGGNPLNYTLGRGRVYLQGDVPAFSLVGANSADWLTHGGWRDVGNVTSFTFTQESETKEHRSNLSGLQVIDLELAVSQKATISFTADETTALNLARFFSGEVSGPRSTGTIWNAAAMASDDAFATGNENFYIDTSVGDNVYEQWIQLSLVVPLTGSSIPITAVDFEAQATQAITVRKAATSRTATNGTVLTEGTHYEIDRKWGRIRFFDVSNGLARGDTIQVNWVAPSVSKAAASPGGGFPATPIGPGDDRMHILSVLATSGKTVGLVFIQENPNDSDIPIKAEFFKVKLRPDGDFQGIGDDWAALSFTGSLESISNPPQGASPYGRIIMRSQFST